MLLAGAPEEGEFPLFVVLVILAVMAVAAAHHRRENPDESSGIAGRSGSHRDKAARPQPERLGHPLDRIEPP